MLAKQHIEKMCGTHTELYTALLGVIAFDRKENSYHVLAEEVVKHRTDAKELGVARVVALMDALWEHGRSGFDNKLKSFLTS